MEVVRSLVACLALISPKAGTCAIQTHSVTIARLLAHRLGTIKTIPTLKAPALRLTQREVLAGVKAVALAVATASVDACWDLTRAAGPAGIALA